MRSRKIALFAAAALLIVASADAPRAATRPYSGIVVFGTSLSDPGNAFALIGGNAVPQDFALDPFLTPTVAYARGGHHLTNGPTWVEQLGQSLGVARSVKPAFKPGKSGATNYAVGAARARQDGVNMDLPNQVDAFLASTGGVAPSDALYVIEMGTNDVRDALLTLGAGGDPAPILTAAVSSIAANITRLYAAGARNFLVWRAPSPAFSPAVRILETIRPGATFASNLLTFNFNSGLETALAGLSLAPGISITRLAADALIASLATNPALYGLTNVTDACLTPNVPPFTCQQPDEYLFWDGIHPTRAVHAIIADAAATALGL